MARSSRGDFDPVRAWFQGPGGIVTIAIIALVVADVIYNIVRGIA